MDTVDNEWEQFLLQFNEFASVSAPSSSTFTANQNIGEQVSKEIVSVSSFETKKDVDSDEENSTS